MSSSSASANKAMRLAALGIDVGERDVFETADPEVTEEAEGAGASGGSGGGDDSDAELPEVNTSKLSASSHTHRKFQGAQLEMGGVDLSGAVSGRRARKRRPGHELNPLVGVLDYEIGPTSKDTLLQRYNRLAYELQKLEDAVGEVEADSPGASIEQDVSLGTMHASLTSLRTQMEELKASPAGAPLLDEDAAVQSTLKSQQAASDALLAKLSAVQSSSSKSGSGAAAGGGTDGAVTYSLYYRPELARLNQSSTLGEVSRRLSDLERIVGSGELAPEDTDAVAASTKAAGTDLVQAVALLDKRLTLLDDDELKKLQRRLTGISAQLDEVLDKQDSIVKEHAFENKLDELYTKVEGWDGMAEVVPAVVERLRTLSALHEDAAGFGDALNSLTAAQAQLTQTCNGNKALLEQVQTAMADNMATIARNVESIEARLSALGH